MARKRKSYELIRARDVVSQAAADMTGIASAKVEQAREIKAAVAKRLSPGQRIAAAIVGFAALAGIGTASVGVARDHVIRPAAQTALGPAYRIQCRLPSGNYGTCTPMRARR